MTHNYSEKLFNAAAQNGLARTPRRLESYLKQLCGKIDFADRSFLDIGGGAGIFALYAACRGARSALCLEPESDGSTSQITLMFEKLKSAVSPVGDRAEMAHVTLQTFEPQYQKFDIVALNNAINHLDEPACIRLLDHTESRASYRELLGKIAEISAPGATLIVADCSRINFFASLGLRNPFAPSIEWHKHQAPETWIELLQDVGFVSPQVRWTPLRYFGPLGQVFWGNRPMAFLTKSHFCIHMKKAPRAGAGTHREQARAA